MKLPITISISDQLKYERTFDTLEAFETFLKSQADFWGQRQGIASQSPTANQFIQRYGGFQTIINQIITWKPQLDTWDAAAFNANFTNLINSYLGTSWLWSGHPFIEKWLELISVSGNTADAFFEAIVQKTTSRFANGIDFFQGYVTAFEYVNQENTEINKRRNSEKKSLSKLSDQLTIKHDELIGSVDKFETNLTKWKDATESGFSEWHITQKTLLDDTVLANSKNFQERLASWMDAHVALEKKFTEEMRLRPSATYWNASAVKLNEQGRKWANALILSTLLGFVTFSVFFIFWLKGEKTVLSLQSFEGVLLFATVVSCFAFLLKSLSKAMFSSFHLQRVAEESELLTNLYLSLKEGKDDDPESRKIVLQALFSRSETGLLSGEHGPTMPSATEFINIIGKAR